MGIVYNEQTKVFTLQTENTAYQMKVGEYGVLLHLYYGERIEDCDLSYLIMRADRGFSGNPYEAAKDRTFSLDYLPLEYPCFGIGDYRTSCLNVENADGTNAVDLRYVSHRIYKGKYSLTGLPSLFWKEDEGETLELTMEDRESHVRVVLFYGVLEKGDVITRAARIENDTGERIYLERAMSLALEINHCDSDLIHFYGKHTMERQPERVPLHHGTQSIGSLRGASSHHHNPFVIVCDKETGEDYGGCVGISLLYSGNFLMEAEVDQIHQTRIVMGIHPDLFRFALEAGEEFIVPEAAMVYTKQGFSDLSHKYHDAYREHLIRSKWQKKRRPVLINNWEATYFDFTGEKLLEIGRSAKELGVEMLVMDDGWFGNRDNDDCGLGDWVVNEKKLGRPLSELVEEVNAMGLKFGIWVEPEMVCEDSDLYRAHPDWTLRIPGRTGNIAREQFVLDFSRKEVREYVENAIFKVLDSANIEYVKWDMNRSICNLYSASLPKERQGEISHRYVLGLYEMLEHFYQRYPDILLEGCSGGGGRFDAGMLYYQPQIWCSDDTDAIERLAIQYGTSFGYPIATMGAHVSACPNHQTERVTPLETRGTVAMAGTFGYELDISRMTPEEKECVKGQIEEYKKYSMLVTEGDYYRLTSPYDNQRVAAWEFVSKDKTYGLFCGVVTKLQANPDPLIVKLKGLEKEAVYEIEGQKLSGAALMLGGILLPVPKEEYQSYRYEIRRV